MESLAAISATACSPELAQVIRRSQELASSSGGAFDITVGAFSRLWNFPDGNTVPPLAALQSASERWIFAWCTSRVIDCDCKQRA